MFRYEDLIEAPEQSLRTIAELIGLSPSHDMISKAVRQCASENLRELERTGQPWRGTREDIYFIRNARVGNWRDELAPESAEMIRMRWPDLMSRLNYFD